MYVQPSWPNPRRLRTRYLMPNGRLRGESARGALCPKTEDNRQHRTAFEKYNTNRSHHPHDTSDVLLLRRKLHIAFDHTVVFDLSDCAGLGIELYQDHLTFTANEVQSRNSTVKAGRLGAETMQNLDLEHSGSHDHLKGIRKIDWFFRVRKKKKT